MGKPPSTLPPQSLASLIGDWVSVDMSDVEPRHARVRQKLAEDLDGCPRVILVSWMPPFVDWTYKFRSIASCVAYFLVGEKDTSFSGRLWETWGKRFSESGSMDTSHIRPPPYESGKVCKFKIILCEWK